MFKILALLPTFWQIAIIILVIVAFVIISLRGKFSLWYGKAKIGFGGVANKVDCDKCISTIRAEEKSTDRKIYKIEHNNLRSKMNFVEQKLLIIKRIIYVSYLTSLHNKLELNNVDYDLEEKESNLFESRLNNALGLMQDEFRRAFKENGFQEKEDNDFKEYIEDESEILINLYEDYLLKNYPNSMYVSRMELNDIVKSCRDKIKGYCDEVFRKAKRIEITSTKEIESIEKENEKRISYLSHGK